jgi:hypothetical protein
MDTQPALTIALSTCALHVLPSDGSDCLVGIAMDFKSTELGSDSRQEQQLSTTLSGISATYWTPILLTVGSVPFRDPDYK